jgi:hypothetical protein
MTHPSRDVIDAMKGNATEVTRRVEILESDRETPWLEGDAALLDGSVSVDMSRAERRNFQVTLDNTDKALHHSPDGFWYDKILRPWRGVRYDRRLSATEAVLADRPLMYYRLGEPSGAFVNRGSLSGFNGTAVGNVVRQGAGAFVHDPDGSVRVNGDLAHVTIPAQLTWPTPVYTVAYWWRSTATTDGAVIGAASGTPTGRPRIRHNFTGTPDQFNFYDGQTTHSVTVPGTRNSVWHMMVFSVGPERVRACIDGRKVLDVAVALPRATPTDIMTMLGASGSTAAFPFDGDIDEVAFYDYELTVDRINAQFSAGRGKYRTERVLWEYALGDFMIDQIESDDFPNRVSITCRDMMKKLMLSKFRRATAFEAGMRVDELVHVIAANGGIEHAKMALPLTAVTTSRDFFFERGSSRQEALAEIGLSYGFDIFFNSDGFLAMEPIQDPAFGPVHHTFKTGPDGDLASFKKTSRDNRIFNVVTVAGEATDTIPVSATVENNMPNSPTRIDKLGERSWEHVSPLITSEQQALELASTYLKIMALEEFSVGMGSLVFPWFEAGQVVKFLDPDPSPADPTTFLMTDFTIPLGLGPMSSTAKRVTIIRS